MAWWTSSDTEHYVTMSLWRKSSPNGSKRRLGFSSRQRYTCPEGFPGLWELHLGEAWWTFAGEVLAQRRLVKPKLDEHVPRIGTTPNHLIATMLCIYMYVIYYICIYVHIYIHIYTYMYICKPMYICVIVSHCESMCWVSTFLSKE